jgi:hypothetical protein
MENKVLRFPKKPVRKLAANDDVSASAEKNQSSPSKAVRALKMVGRVIRFALFMVMYWLRVIVVNVCSIVSVVMLFAWLFSMYAFPDKTNMVWAFGTISLACFVVAWAYDFVLMKLSPVPMIDSL